MSPDDQEISIVSHSQLFYWWPVWAIGYLLAMLTFWDGYFMAIVPRGTEARRGVEVSVPTPDGKGVTEEKRDILIFPGAGEKKGGLPAKDKALADDPKSEPAPLKLHVAKGQGYGVLYAMVLLLVIVITNVPLRGLWSVVVIVMVIMLSIIFHLADLWEPILRNFSYLDIRINAGGFVFISTVLFVIWLVTLMLFDRQIYMIFTPGQLKVCTEIGGGEKVYDAMGMTVEKQRSDLFRHWILGLGSGDLVVKTAGAQAHHFDLPNVLFIGRKVQQIEMMLKKKAVIETK
jgi:hypothetical protein